MGWNGTRDKVKGGAFYTPNITLEDTFRKGKKSDFWLSKNIVSNKIYTLPKTCDF
jgi:hypothetical protein